MTKLLERNEAIFIGLAAMLGAGVFVVWTDAVALAGPFLVPAVFLAGLVAYLNAMTIAQLSAQVRGNGGTYAYARKYLNPHYGFLAGLAFLVGKVGSAAAIAMTVGRYFAPGFEVPVALGSVLLMTLVNIDGINRTAFGSKVLVFITLVFFGLLILSAFWDLEPTGSGILAPNSLYPTNFQSVLTASSLLFFAFAGYARVATLAGEVRNSPKAVPSAIRISLFVVLVIYLLLAIFLPQKLGWGLANSPAPVATFSDQTMPWLPSEVVILVAGIASLGSLLALMAGMSRTAATMAKDGELPKALTKVNSKGAPWLAELLVAGLVLALTSMGDILFMVGISSFCILVYYAIANLAALQQPEKKSSGRPKWLNILGFILCLAIGLSVPFLSMVAGASILLFGTLLRLGIAKFRRVS